MPQAAAAAAIAPRQHRGPANEPAPQAIAADQPRTAKPVILPPLRFLTTAAAPAPTTVPTQAGIVPQQRENRSDAR